MARTVDEWIGRDDNQAIPARVRVRIFDKAGGACAICSRKIGGIVRPAIDHIIPIIAGGKNRESNLQLLCMSPCHAQKTKRDVAEKSMIARKHAKHLGILTPRRQQILSRGFAKAEPQRTASRPIARQSDK